MYLLLVDVGGTQCADRVKCKFSFVRRRIYVLYGVHTAFHNLKHIVYHHASLIIIWRARSVVEPLVSQ